MTNLTKGDGLLSSNSRGRIYWYDQYALNDQETAFSNYDPDRIADELTDTGADIIALYAANQFSIAYYPSKIWPQHPNLKGRDYFGELMTRLKDRGKKVIAYINWLESRHPEWNMIPIGHEDDPYYTHEMPLASWADHSDPDRRVQNVPGGHWRYPCINSPRREQVVAITEEIVERYQPDGFHLDMFHNTHICVCQYCRPFLEGICGRTDFTIDDIKAHWREYIDWRCSRSASLLADLSKILKKHGVVAAHNGQNPIVLPVLFGIGEEWLPYLDVYVSEIFSDLHSAGMTIKWHAGIHKPSWELLTSSVPTYAHLTVPEATWQLSAAVCRANGCEVFGPCGIGAYPDTTTSLSLLDTVRNGFNAFMQDADLEQGAVVSAAKIALVFSWATRKYFKQGEMNWSHEIGGWSRLLVEEHLPFDIITAEEVSGSEDLSRYDLIILPNNANLSETFCSAVTQYADTGGSVLAVAETSLEDERGLALPDFRLRELLGIRDMGSAEGNFAIEHNNAVLPATGILRHVESSGDVVARHIAVDPVGSVAGCKDPLPIQSTQWPIATVQSFGKGKSAYIAYDIGLHYEMDRLMHTRALMFGLVDAVLPERQVSVKAPACVEISIREQPEPKRTVIYLANLTQSQDDMSKIHEIIPIHGIEIELVSPCDKPSVSCRGGEVTVHSNSGKLRLGIDCLDVCAAILIEERV